MIRIKYNKTHLTGVLVKIQLMNRTPSLHYYFSFFIAYLLLTNARAQIAASTEIIYGKEKTMLSLVGDLKTNEMVHFGAFIKTGSLRDFYYPDITYEYDEENVPVQSSNSSYTFPYGPLPYLSDSSALFMGGKTKTFGWSVGGYFCLNKSLDRKDKNWFFIRFDLEHLRLSDQYDLLWAIRAWNGMSMVTTTRKDQGTYNYHAVGIATRAGYKLILGKDEQLFIQCNLGVSYYHPYYPQPMEGGQSGYWTGTPFMGVEFEVGAGVGYLFRKNKHR